MSTRWDDQLDAMDASVFSSDMMFDPDRYPQFKEHVERWSRAIAEHEQAAQPAAQEPARIKGLLHGARSELYRALTGHQIDEIMDELQAGLLALLAKAQPAAQEPRRLTDAQIGDIVREASKGAATRRDGTTSTRIARAVEAAIAAQPAAQEPKK